MSIMCDTLSLTLFRNAPKTSFGNTFFETRAPIINIYRAVVNLFLETQQADYGLFTCRYVYLVDISFIRSLPRDVYIRRKNDHPGGQGRIYTSNLNFVFSHLSKPGH